MAEPVSEETARNRWLVIQLTRLLGVATALVGLLMIQGVIETVPLVGYLLLAVGIADVFVIPRVLARQWRTPRE